MAYSNCGDGTLVLLTLAGEQKAYEELVRRHEKSVVAAAYSVSKNCHVAEDSAQDAFVAAWIKLDSLRDPEKFGIWVRKIAGNCARNMVSRFYGVLSLDEMIETAELGDSSVGPAESLELSEEKIQLRTTVESLPARTRQVIYLHYYEDLSVSEIARRLSVSEGTVKGLLFDGRKKIRKELCAADESVGDTLLQKVMKKVEELRKYKFRNSKAGFESDYRSVLGDIEKLPETLNKYHAKAEVLMMGYWWLPGEKNAKLFEQIREAAELGKNEEVMYFVALKESWQYYGEGRINFVKNGQIPRLEADGFETAAASLALDLAYCAVDMGKYDIAREALEKALSYKRSNTRTRVCAKALSDRLEIIESPGFNKNPAWNKLYITAFDIVRTGDKIQVGDVSAVSAGSARPSDIIYGSAVCSSAGCDKTLAIGGLRPGEKFTGSDGSYLLRCEDEAVETVCGLFEGCEVWRFVSADSSAKTETWLKSGVGIVRLVSEVNGYRREMTLKSYKNVSGSGLLPLAKGNVWEYDAGERPGFVESSVRLSVEETEGKNACLCEVGRWKRLKYDENSWQDMVNCISNEYMIRDKKSGEFVGVRDLSHEIERAEALAATPMQKAHIKAAGSTAKRLCETFKEGSNTQNLWNFFTKREISRREDGKTTLSDWSIEWSFELKSITGESCEDQAVYNHLFDILRDSVGYIWSDEWTPGYKGEVVHIYDNTAIRSVVECADAGRVEVPAGCFENCIKVSFETDGYTAGMEYLNAKKEYCFSPGIGIVRAVFSPKGVRPVSYELVSFSGRGEGYLPFGDGFTRRYETVGATDGVFGASDYIFVADGDGRFAAFCDLTGIRRPVENITDYSLILGERTENDLAEEGKAVESNIEGSFNSFNLLIHSTAKCFHGYYDPSKRAERLLYCCRMIRAADPSGGVPPALDGLYAECALCASVAFFGAGCFEEGYKYLDEAIECASRFDRVKNGEKLSVGDPAVFGGMTWEKGSNFVGLPDGAARKIEGWQLRFGLGNILYSLTAERGWEWFDGARNEQRFKDTVARVRELIEKQ